MNVEERLKQMRYYPECVLFKDLCEICEHFFGSPRPIRGHLKIYRMPWEEDPRIMIQSNVNIQNKKTLAKTYQVKLILRAIERLEHLGAY